MSCASFPHWKGRQLSIMVHELRDRSMALLFLRSTGNIGSTGLLARLGTLAQSRWCTCSTRVNYRISMLLGLEATARLSGLVTLLEFSVRSYLVGNAGSRPISEAKQPWACLVLRWGTTGEAHVLYSKKATNYQSTSKPPPLSFYVSIWRVVWFVDWFGLSFFCCGFD